MRDDPLEDLAAWLQDFKAQAPQLGITVDSRGSDTNPKPIRAWGTLGGLDEVKSANTKNTHDKPTTPSIPARVQAAMDLILSILKEEGALRTAKLNELLKQAGHFDWQIRQARAILLGQGLIMDCIPYSDFFTRLVDYEQKIICASQDKFNPLKPHGV